MSSVTTKAGCCEWEVICPGRVVTDLHSILHGNLVSVVGLRGAGQQGLQGMCNDHAALTHTAKRTVTAWLGCGQL